ncbi:MAG: GNAT family N-acetyltransferase [Planctomycetia bacterium]|nr:GNAT family N-acetyltransferase [Planctomycetia bacterium]
MCAVSSTLGMADRTMAAGKTKAKLLDLEECDRPTAGGLEPAATLPLAPFVWGKLEHLPESPVIVEGRAADHPAVQCFLGEAFHGVQRDAFVASLEDPFYEPRDRLLVKRGTQILGHATLAHRVQRWGERRIPCSELRRVATAPCSRKLGVASALMETAERRIREDGSELAVLSTQIPHFFRRFNYAVCGRSNTWQMAAQQVLAALPEAAWRSDGHAKITTRPWRQIELPALMRIYRTALDGVHGPLERTEAYWRWLISRQQFDRIYVAISGRDRCELQRDESDAEQSPIVGYAVIREDCVLELLTLPGQTAAAEQLLARAAAETIELDRQVVTVHAPPMHSLNAIFHRAGGLRQYQEYWQGAVTMVKLLAPAKFLHSLRDSLHERARAVGQTAPWDLTLAVEDTRYQLSGTRRTVKVQEGAGSAKRRGLSMNRTDFTRLALGHLDLRGAHAAGRIRASSGAALELAAALFPALPLWTPPWDGLGL